MTFRPMTVHIASGCTSYVNYTNKPVYVDLAVPYFTVNTYNPEVGEPVYTVNNSINPASLYQWDFGPDATPRYSNLSNPNNIIFNSPGVKSIKLVVTAPFGCQDSMIKNVNVISPVVNGNCEYSRIYSGGQSEHSFSFDKQDNLIYAFNGDQSALYKSVGNHGDSIVLSITPITFKYERSIFLSKYNSKGIPQWLTRLWFESNYADALTVTTDNNDNIYCSYFHGEYNDSIRAYSTDERYITFNPPHKNSDTNSVVIVKYNKNGILQWHNTFYEHYTMARTALKTDSLGNLYVISTSYFCKYNSNGQLLWMKKGSYLDIEFDTQGNIWTTTMADLILQKYDTLGNLLYSTPPINKLISTTGINGIHIRTDIYDNIYVGGNFSGQFVFGNDTLSDIYTGGGTHADGFICKFKPNGQQEWIKQFKSDQFNAIKGLDIKNNHIIILGLCTDTVYLKNLPPINFSTSGYYLYHIDTLGGAETYQILHSPQTFIMGLSGEGELAVFRNNNDDIALEIAYNNSFQLGSNSIVPLGFGSNYLISNTSLNCIFPNLPLQPSSYFTFSPSPIYTNDSIHFVDQSTNNPTSWSWTFMGANITSSTLQNPTVVFSSPGTYKVTLTASNANGIGSTYVYYVTVTVSTSLFHSKLSQISIYPNPTTSKFNIDFGNKISNINVDIVDLVGKKIYESSFENAKDAEIDISNQSNGIYFLNIYSETEKKTFKIVKN